MAKTAEVGNGPTGEVVAVSNSPVQPKVSWVGRLEMVGERAGLPIILVVVVVFFSLYPSTSATFPTSANIQNILANQSVTGLIALGMVIPLVAGFFDLSVAASAGMSSVTVASLVSIHQQPIWLAIIAGILVAVAAGVVNGVLVGVLQLNPFITTFGTYIVISGLLQWYTQGQTILNGVPPSMALWASGKWLGAPRVFWVLMLTAVAVWYLLRHTPFGRYLAAIGSNENAARLAGIRVDRSVFIAFMLSGLLAGMAGALLTTRMGTADSGTALSYLFPALAAVFLGQTSINPGQYNVWGTIFGVYLVAAAVAGFTLLGAAAWIQQLFNGLALLISLVVSTFTARARDRRARSQAV
ncbi:hypothetical protein ASC77_23695 [Nocardioides sp. Root1257]|uniref:ABC transporter permease n=1 Tax=unclassified Nocardioides TaxID=2615069 RepID=UPI0006FBE590|nr:MULTISPECIES: ABC transporter permease [unclassified Nocardioides]KQW42665.1 hypothetical protein ASC77_23695 [Nocardioides sp. Root1257]KRC39923.1 hypothetical protein ASE24_23490 [Nocardioides sp. Root224]